MSQIGLVFTPRSPAQIVSTVQAMEERGFTLAGMLDTHSRSMDVYVALAIAAASSSRIRLGPCVTNPTTRDISVSAAAIASINLLAPSRTYLGLSKGFSGTAAVGVTTSKTSSLLKIVPQMRSSDRRSCSGCRRSNDETALEPRADSDLLGRIGTIGSAHRRPGSGRRYRSHGPLS